MKSSTITADDSSSEIDTGFWLFLDISHFECERAEWRSGKAGCYIWPVFLDDNEVKMALRMSVDHRD